MSGIESSGKTDGGTSSRVFGSFLTWMQEHESTVFPIATANDVSKLPPEFIRRFDEIFYAGLPTEKELEQIWSIQIKKYRRDPKKYDVLALAKASHGFTGAEIEKCVVDALYKAYQSKLIAPNQEHFVESLNIITPVSDVMGEKIEQLEAWAKNRARNASIVPVVNTERSGNFSLTSSLGDFEDDPF